MEIIPVIDQLFTKAMAELDSRGVPIVFSWSTCPMDNAWTLYNPDEKIYEIHITRDFLKNVYRMIFNSDTFDSVIIKIINNNSINRSEIEKVKSFLLIIIMNMCFYHELGHIVDGHLNLHDRDNRLAENEIVIPQAKMEFTLRSMLETDADAYAAMRTVFFVANHCGISCDKDKLPIFLKQLTLFAAMILFYFLSSNAGGAQSYNYPPYLWRLFSINIVFLQVFSSLCKGKNIEQFENHIRVDDEFSEEHFDPETLEIIHSALEAIRRDGVSTEKIFSYKYLTSWYDFYRKNLPFLSAVHENIKKLRGIS